MEPSSIDELRVELFRLLRAARCEETYLSLDILAALLCETLREGEHLLLADLLFQYETRRLTAEVRSF